LIDKKTALVIISDNGLLQSSTKRKKKKALPSIISTEPDGQPIPEAP